MTAVGVLTLCAVLFTLTVIVIGIFVVRSLIQVRETAREAQDFLRRVDPLLRETEQAVREWRELGDRLGNTVEHAERFAAQFEGMGSKAVRASQVVLSGIGGPVGRALSLWNALKAGTNMFFRITGRDHKGASRASKARQT